MPHQPHKRAEKVKAIQRSLDWKRVTQIAAYLLQEEIVDAPDKLDTHFRHIYEPKKFDSGREWPPKVPRVVGYQRSEYPTFSNVLLHVNGAKVKPYAAEKGSEAAKLVFDEKDAQLNFSVIDGQHRINGAFLALCLLKEMKNTEIKWEIPAEVFLDLDPEGEPPRRQAQIFIDINSYQKKVDRSLVADLFPTARGRREPIDNKERAQDLGRKLMLEIGPLVGMIQIPGIKYGVKDVVTLATLNAAIEDVLEPMIANRIESLDSQAIFLSQCLDAWLIATGRKEEIELTDRLDPENVAYQGRVVVSYMTLVPACIMILKKSNTVFISSEAHEKTITWLEKLIERTGLGNNGKLVPKSTFKSKGYYGSGGLARFRNTLWAASLSTKSVADKDDDELLELANKHKSLVEAEIYP